MADLSKNAEKVMEMVEKMTVLELADLVKAMEDKFGVSAAAPVAAAAPAAGAEAAEAEPEKSEYNVVLKDGGDQKIGVIKVVRTLDPSLGLVDAKNLVEQGDAVILENAKKEDAENAKQQLEEAGATVELQ